MQTVDEKPETIHLYVVREEAPKPSASSYFPAQHCSLFARDPLCFLLRINSRKYEKPFVFRLSSSRYNIYAQQSDHPNRYKNISGNNSAWNIDNNEWFCHFPELPQGLIFPAKWY